MHISSTVMGSGNTAHSSGNSHVYTLSKFATDTKSKCFYQEASKRCVKTILKIWEVVPRARGICASIVYVLYMNCDFTTQKCFQQA